MLKIGLLVIATGKYDIFIPPLFKSVKKHFFKNDDVKLYVFTDQDIPNKENIVKIAIPHEPWPNPTLKRYHHFFDNKDVFSDREYLFYCDVDMLFVGDVDKEILPEKLLGVEHPGFYGGRRGTYDDNKDSTAYVAPNHGDIYYAGGFNGGTKEDFLNMSEHIKHNVDIYFSKNIIAKWHDESHMNRYFIDNPPKTLNPSYCYPEKWNLPFEKKLLALDKNHAEIRK